MIVIRIGGHGHQDLIESKPCVNCVRVMQNLNIKHVTYTTSTVKKNICGVFNTEKITQIKTHHMSQMTRMNFKLKFKN